MTGLRNYLAGLVQKAVKRHLSDSIVRYRSDAVQLTDEQVAYIATSYKFHRIVRSMENDEH